MALPFTPRNWYWFVGGDGPHLDENGDYTGDTSRVYSTAANEYVPADDPAYVAWRDARRAEVGAPADSTFEPATRIDTEENLAAVLELYGIDPDFSGPPPP